MKHENSNASTATTTSSSATTPPTPEINGNIPNNNNHYQENFNHFQNYQQSPMPPHNSHIAAENTSTNHQQHLNPSEINLQQQLQQQHPQSIIPPAINTWNPQHYYPTQTMATNFQPTNEMVNNNPVAVQPAPVQHHHHQQQQPQQQQQSPVTTNNGEFVGYADQYAHSKYEQIQQTAAVTPPAIPNHYETWVS
jgi:hypothetical protein